MVVRGVLSAGMTVAITVFEALDTGDHVIAPVEMYWTIQRWLQDLFGGSGERCQCVKPSPLRRPPSEDRIAG
jgi:hypothetical protein